MRTGGQLLQDTPNTDGQIFVPATRMALTAGTAPATTSAAGLLYSLVAASGTANFFDALSTLLRTGQAPNYQEQFGTAASVPGPSAVANTSDPLAITGIPPITNLQMPTVKGAQTGYIPKGLQINWIDVIYQVLGVNLTSVTYELSKTIFKNAVAPAVTALVALAANGLTTAVAAQPTRTRITPATPVFSVDDGTELISNLNFVTPAGSTVKFYGIIYGVSFNYN